MGLKDDEYYIKKAIRLAINARESGNEPFESLLVDEDKNILTEETEEPFR